MNRAATSHPSAPTFHVRVNRTWPKLADSDPNVRKIGCRTSVAASTMDGVGCSLAEKPDQPMIAASDVLSRGSTKPEAEVAASRDVPEPDSLGG